METLSVVIASKNCESRIKGTVEPWKPIANEIIVVDQYSTDRTAEIAKNLGCVVIQNNPADDNFSINRKMGLQAAKSDWIVYIDTDERPTVELIEEIKNFLNSESKKYNGARLPNRFYFIGKPLRYGIFDQKTAAEIRMFRQGKWHYPGELGIHYSVSVEGEVYRFKNYYKHFNVNTLSEWFIKTNQYTEVDSIKNFEKTSFDGIYFFKIFYKAVKFFVKHFFIKKGFLDGPRGFLSVLFFMFYHIIYL